MKIEFKGKQYRGYDGGKNLSLNGPGLVDVSDAKGEQLLKDYPKQWFRVGEAPAKKEEPVQTIATISPPEPEHTPAEDTEEPEETPKPKAARKPAAPKKRVVKRR